MTVTRDTLEEITTGVAGVGMGVTMGDFAALAAKYDIEEELIDHTFERASSFVRALVTLTDLADYALAMFLIGVAAGRADAAATIPLEHE